MPKLLLSTLKIALKPCHQATPNHFFQVGEIISTQLWQKDQPNYDATSKLAVCVDAEGKKVYVNPQGKYVCLEDYITHV